ncbi:MAG: zinc ABC transporter substrate-binding protein [Cellulomonadaceae bacterium]|nr:zinc ABC transporter substrate-binding protein [Cellulomonadaceae bacterium]
MMLMLNPRRLAALAVPLTVAVALSGCSAPEADPGTVTVMASFYPLAYVVEQVGGDLVDVASLTPPGAEPHDVELSPRQVRDLGDADLAVYLAGFQPSVDEAVASRAPSIVVDAAASPDVATALSQHEDDPHFWLDPTLLAAVGHDVAAALAEADPDNADTYTAGAAALDDTLLGLDADLTAGLTGCERDVIVTAHAAFGYLAARYGFEQVGVSGLDPESEPSPARLREIRDVVTEHGVTTIFTEALVSPDVAETLAGDLGVTTAVLDPIESQVDPGTDYRGAMEQNLVALRAAMGCS